ncbi:hypothetical protein D3C75_894560 [compost metagenome]
MRGHYVFIADDGGEKNILREPQLRDLHTSYRHIPVDGNMVEFGIRLAQCHQLHKRRLGILLSNQPKSGSQRGDGCPLNDCRG